MKKSILVGLGILLGLSAAPAADNPWPAVTPTDKPGDPVLEEPTLHCLGVYWIVAGDPEKQARVEVTYRPAGKTAWQAAMPLFRVQHGATSQNKKAAQLNPPDDAWIFAGSILGLAPDTAYEIKLRLVKPAGAAVEKLLKSRTLAEPKEPAGMRVRHVVPGKGGGDGSERAPFQGLDAAQKIAQPGDLFLVHKGAYDAPFSVKRSGEPGKPIIWRGAGDGEAAIDGGGQANRGVETSGVHDVWLEKLSVKGVAMGVLFIDSSRIVVRRCHLYDLKCGMYTHMTDEAKSPKGLFISDNLMEGPFTWGQDNKGAKVDEYRGIQFFGMGHVVCYNRIRNFKDGMDTFPSKYCAAIDFHNNEVSECMDDGCEMDFSERNTRCFNNRFTNVFQGVSEQPIFGGPTYIVRNVLYNVMVEPFKLHNNGAGPSGGPWAPSGALILHNTIVKKDEPFILWSGAPVYNCVTRNNLFIGGGRRAMDFEAMMTDCDFDYDGFGGGPWPHFMKWNKVLYASVDEARAKAPVERHAVLVDAATVFASGLGRPTDVNVPLDPAKNDLRLRPGSAAIDAGDVLPNINDGFTGKAPDLGAYELGSPLPHYGPRPEK
jgi:hypothetical protein